jgi:uncharacterized protein YprB with RNaseH-like and TPR domain
VQLVAAAADKFARLAALKPARSTSLVAALRAPDREDALSQLVGAAVGTNRYGEYVSVRSWFSSPELTEPSHFGLGLLSRTRDQSLSKRHRAAVADTNQWLFLDTETTGLTGGTGTYAFLIGLAWWDAGGLQVEQLFMRDFAEEHAILHELAVRVTERPVLLTFNGKSFDWPLLESRFAMTRVITAPRPIAHLDLLHPARALWKLRLGSVRLVELERHVLGAANLGWDRVDDVVSALIPQHYFDYLRGGPAHPLAAVIRHNQMDLRGLAALFGKIDGLLNANDAAEREEVASLDMFGLSRFLKRRGDCDRAQVACAQALELGLPAEYQPRARRDLAQHAKRRGDHESAVALWEQLAAEATDDAQDGIHACEQLAIYYERRVRDFARAMEFAQLAAGMVRRARASCRDPYAAARHAHAEQRFLQRIARLKQRCETAASGDLLPT